MVESDMKTSIKKGETDKIHRQNKRKVPQSLVQIKHTMQLHGQFGEKVKQLIQRGLKGSALKYAKSYNSSLKQGNNIASKVKAGKTVKTSGMSNILKSTAQAYNVDAKEKASAQKVYDNAKKADEKSL